MSRLAARFAALKAAQRSAFIPFITAGDPDAATTQALLRALPGAGADIIELGIPFSDPMADGPAIQASSLRALNAGISVTKIFNLVASFRSVDTQTPLVLMGYYNPIHAYGIERFIADAAAAGVDGLITVDLPPEEDAVLREPSRAQGIDVVRLATPTSGPQRLKTITADASGFLYYVSVAGVTGTKEVAEDAVAAAIERVRRTSQLPVAVGFGIRTPQQAAKIARLADAVVVGSAIVTRIAAAHAKGLAGEALLAHTLEFCRELSDAVHGARGQTC
ncbi:MAG: tryptophan synthase subunit alpha [Alphaproteobacteria bacterium]|nr:tryptophan synthase subunit alpha [Alphaproteobacteria bacterium]